MCWQVSMDLVLISACVLVFHMKCDVMDEVVYLNMSFLMFALFDALDVMDMLCLVWYMDNK